MITSKTQFLSKAKEDLLKKNFNHLKTLIYSYHSYIETPEEYLSLLEHIPESTSVSQCKEFLPQIEQDRIKFDYFESNSVAKYLQTLFQKFSIEKLQDWVMYRSKSIESILGNVSLAMEWLNFYHLNNQFSFQMQLLFYIIYYSPLQDFSFSQLQDLSVFEKFQQILLLQMPSQEEEDHLLKLFSNFFQFFDKEVQISQYSKEQFYQHCCNNALLQHKSFSPLLMDTHFILFLHSQQISFDSMIPYFTDHVVKYCNTSEDVATVEFFVKSVPKEDLSSEMKLKWMQLKRFEQVNSFVISHHGTMNSKFLLQSEEEQQKWLSDQIIQILQHTSQNTETDFRTLEQQILKILKPFASFAFMEQITEEFIFQVLLKHHFEFVYELIMVDHILDFISNEQEKQHKIEQIIKRASTVFATQNQMSLLQKCAKLKNSLIDPGINKKAWKWEELVVEKSKELQLYFDKIPPASLLYNLHQSKEFIKEVVRYILLNNSRESLTHYTVIVSYLKGLLSGMSGNTNSSSILVEQEILFWIAKICFEEWNEIGIAKHICETLMEQQYAPTASLLQQLLLHLKISHDKKLKMLQFCLCYGQGTELDTVLQLYTSMKPISIDWNQLMKKKLESYSLEEWSYLLLLWIVQEKVESTVLVDWINQMERYYVYKYSHSIVTLQSIYSKLMQLCIIIDQIQTNPSLSLQQLVASCQIKDYHSILCKQMQYKLQLLQEIQLIQAVIHDDDSFIMTDYLLQENYAKKYIQSLAFSMDDKEIIPLALDLASKHDISMEQIVVPHLGCILESTEWNTATIIVKVNQILNEKPYQLLHHPSALPMLQQEMKQLIDEKRILGTDLQRLHCVYSILQKSSAESNALVVADLEVLEQLLTCDMNSKLNWYRLKELADKQEDTLLIQYTLELLKGLQDKSQLHLFLHAMANLHTNNSQTWITKVVQQYLLQYLQKKNCSYIVIKEVVEQYPLAEDQISILCKSIVETEHLNMEKKIEVLQTVMEKYSTIVSVKEYLFNISVMKQVMESQGLQSYYKWIQQFLFQTEYTWQQLSESIVLHCISYHNHSILEVLTELRTLLEKEYQSIFHSSNELLPVNQIMSQLITTCFKLLQESSMNQQVEELDWENSIVEQVTNWKEALLSIHHLIRHLQYFAEESEWIQIITNQIHQIRNDTSTDAKLKLALLQLCQILQISISSPSLLTETQSTHIEQQHTGQAWVLCYQLVALLHDKGHIEEEAKSLELIPHTNIEQWKEIYCQLIENNMVTENESILLQVLDQWCEYYEKNSEEAEASLWKMFSHCYKEWFLQWTVSLATKESVLFTSQLVASHESKIEKEEQVHYMQQIMQQSSQISLSIAALFALQSRHGEVRSKGLEIVKQKLVFSSDKEDTPQDEVITRYILSGYVKELISVEKIIKGLLFEQIFIKDSIAETLLLCAMILQSNTAQQEYMLLYACEYLTKCILNLSHGLSTFKNSKIVLKQYLQIQCQVCQQQQYDDTELYISIFEKAIQTLG